MPRPRNHSDRRPFDPPPAEHGHAPFQQDTVYPGYERREVREPLPVPQLPQLRHLIRAVCIWESGKETSSEGALDERAKRKAEMNTESMSRAELLRCVDAACGLVWLTIFEGGEEVAILDRNGKRQSVGNEGP